jgi:hypothetical protein
MRHYFLVGWQILTISKRQLKRLPLSSRFDSVWGSTLVNSNLMIQISTTQLLPTQRNQPLFFSFYFYLSIDGDP